MRTVEGASLADQDRLRADGNAAVEGFFVIRKRQGAEAKFRSQVGDGGDFAVELLTDRAAEQLTQVLSESCLLPNIDAEELEPQLPNKGCNGDGTAPQGRAAASFRRASKTPFVGVQNVLCAKRWQTVRHRLAWRGGSSGLDRFWQTRECMEADGVRFGRSKRSRFVCPNVVNKMRLPVRGVEVREVLRTGGSQELFEGLTHESDRARRRSGNS